MKTKIFSLPVIILFVCASWISPPQSSPDKELLSFTTKQNTAFAFFRTHRQGKGIKATWGMTLINGIGGFMVQRTYEDPADPYANWEDLDLIPINARRSFTYLDNLVFPGIINYRIVAVMTDGSSVVSDISSVRIVSRK